MQKVLDYVATLGRNNLLFLSTLLMSIPSRSEHYKRRFGGCCSLGRFLTRRPRSTVSRVFQEPVSSAVVERRGLAR